MTDGKKPSLYQFKSVYFEEQTALISKIVIVFLIIEEFFVPCLTIALCEADLLHVTFD